MRDGAADELLGCDIPTNERQFTEEASMAAPLLRTRKAAAKAKTADARTDMLRLPRPLATLVLCLVTVIWGAQHAIIKKVLAPPLPHEAAADPAALNLLRFALAALCFSPWLPRPSSGRSPDKASARLEWQGGAELGVLQFLGFSLQAVGLLYTTAQRSCLLLYLNVKLVPFFACALFGQRVPLSTWLSAAGALAGTVLLLDGASASKVPPNVGDALSLLAAAASALFILRLERYAPNTTGRGLNATCMAIVTLLCIPWMISDELATEALQEPSPRGWQVVHLAVPAIGSKLWQLLRTQLPALAYLGIATTALTSWLQTVAQRTVPASSAAIIYALDPVWGCLFAYLWLDERLSMEGLCGVMLLLGSVLSQFAAAALVDTAGSGAAVDSYDGESYPGKGSKAAVGSSPEAYPG